MLVHIFPSRLISEVQKEFNALFPFLKLEFFRHKNYAEPDYSAQSIIPHNRKIAEGQAAITDGKIDITPDMKVIELENMLKKDFSLAAQVFRRSGNLWLETTMTDNWTLEQQNEHGKEISTPKVTDPNKDISDFDLTRDADH